MQTTEKPAFNAVKTGIYAAGPSPHIQRCGSEHADLWVLMNFFCSLYIHKFR